MNKSLITNLLSALLVLGGYLSPVYSDQILSVGLFSLSGALTNWLAIHMLFEKVPFLYGSGIIPLKFEAFKVGIRDLIMGQFFNQDNLRKFLEEESDVLTDIDLSLMSTHVPLDKLFEKLKEAVMESQLGGMLSMFGGESALEPMREPFKVKIGEALKEMSEDEGIKKAIHDAIAGSLTGDSFIEKIEQIVEGRLSELTPQKVKEIIQQMIKEHLGWLVVWGGVFGGIIGLVASFI
jgi:uncharacterized membrane protein YheB (UPF0754 family)